MPHPRFSIIVFTLLISLPFQLRASRPNVILFLVDDLGWADLGVQGSDLYQTPNVDRLAESGVRFTEGYAACTVCSPTRASIMTGKYPARIRVTDWIAGHQRPHAQLAPPDWTHFLEPQEFNLAEQLQAAGYRTAHVGKWHLGESPIYWPDQQGFDVNIGGWRAGSPAAYGGNGYFSPYNNPRLEDGPENEYLTERLAEEAARFIADSASQDKPFFLNFWLYNVHLPLQAKEEKIQKYRDLVREDAMHHNATYAAMVEHMDDAVGRVLKALEEAKIKEETLIIFTSDNGGIVGNFGGKSRHVTTNGPLRSGKGDMYEGGVRVPLIVSWPGSIPPKRVSSELAISPDLYPTILDICGLPLDAIIKEKIDGISLKQHLLSGEATGRDSIYWHYPHYHSEGARPYSALRNGDWKLIHHYESGAYELFDLKSDIAESINLFKQRPSVSERLVRELNEWREALAAQSPVFNNNYIPRLKDSRTFVDQIAP